MDEEENHDFSLRTFGKLTKDEMRKVQTWPSFQRGLGMSRICRRG